MPPRTSLMVFFIAMIIMVSGCAYNDTGPVSSSGPVPSSSTSHGPVSSSPSDPGPVYGVIDAIEPISGKFEGIGGTGIGVGAVIGGVVGGMIGHQVGGGTGKDAATVAGVAGGALLGHEIEKRTMQEKDGYRIRVRFENGGNQTVEQKSIEELHVGDRARIENNMVYRVYRN